MSSPALEAFLARLYTDETVLSQFLEEPRAVAAAAGLDAAAIVALCELDRDVLVMTARSYRAKRAAQAKPRQRPSRFWRGRRSAP